MGSDNLPPTAHNKENFQDGHITKVLSASPRVGGGERELLVLHQRVHGFTFRSYVTKRDELFSWDIKTKCVDRFHSPL